MTTIVGGTTYRLEPGENRVLPDQMAGKFTYEVPGVQQPVERVLSANQTFIIYVYPTE